MNPRVFREYDIRGHGESDFTDDFVAQLAAMEAGISPEEQNIC